MQSQLLKANASAGLLLRPLADPIASAARLHPEVIVRMEVLPRDRDVFPGSRLRDTVVLLETALASRVAATMGMFQHNNAFVATTILTNRVIPKISKP